VSVVPTSGLGASSHDGQAYRRAVETTGLTASLTIEAAIDSEHAQEFWELYLTAFEPLRTRAAARQVLHRDEFFAEMTDSRVWKYVAWIDGNRPVALATMTNCLETVPWISPEYFRARYPEHAARDAIYYLGFTLVHPNHRDPRIFEAMFRLGMQRLIADRAVCAWDLCAYNQGMGFADRIETLLHRWADVEVLAIDSQTYWAATYA
jgi:hypothetical protein